MNVAVNVNDLNPVAFEGQQALFRFPKSMDMRYFWTLVDALNLRQYLVEAPMEEPQPQGRRKFMKLKGILSETGEPDRERIARAISEKEQEKRQREEVA